MTERSLGAFENDARVITTFGIPWRVISDRRKWGLGGSVSFNPDETIVRLWIGPIRLGTAYTNQGQES